jgi:hypothetical protein
MSELGVTSLIASGQVSDRANPHLPDFGCFSHTENDTLAVTWPHVDISCSQSRNNDLSREAAGHTQPQFPADVPRSFPSPPPRVLRSLSWPMELTDEIRVKEHSAIQRESLFMEHRTEWQRIDNSGTQESLTRTDPDQFCCRCQGINFEGIFNRSNSIPAAEEHPTMCLGSRKDSGLNAAHLSTIPQ